MKLIQCAKHGIQGLRGRTKWRKGESWGNQEVLTCGCRIDGPDRSGERNA